MLKNKPGVQSATPKEHPMNKPRKPRSAHKRELRAAARDKSVRIEPPPKRTVFVYSTTRRKYDVG